MAVTLPQVTYQQVVNHYEGDPAELGSQTYVETKIGQTVRKLASRLGTRIEARIASGRLDPDLFRDVVAEAVLRVVRNPEGFTTEQQGNYQYGLRASVASGLLMFTDDNLRDLIGSPGPVLGTVTIGDHREA